MSGEDVVLAAVKAEIREPHGWTVRCELGGGGYIVYAEHPASFGLILETATSDASLAAARAIGHLDAAQRELVVVDAAPELRTPTP